LSDDRNTKQPGDPEQTEPKLENQVAADEPSHWKRVPGTDRHHELEWKEVRQGRKPGERIVRVVRPHSDEFRHSESGALVVTEKANAPRTAIGRVLQSSKRVLIGRPIATAMQHEERLTKVKALAVLSSDALSSSAYAIEEILLALVVAGSGVLFLNLPISVAIATLLAIVVFSYRQTIKAYPRGGGSYIVSKDNLGNAPALVAGSSLLIGYLLTVCVSISAGVAAITSAVQFLLPYRVELALFFIVLITVINLRGIREAGSIFTLPTYLFIVSILVMIAVSLFRAATSGGVVPPPPIEATEAVTFFLLLRAFASGCAALTGIEAISDGVPAFKPPEWRNARTTLTIMGVLLSILFLGISFLAFQFGIAPKADETVVSQIARTVFGIGIPYYIIQAATMLILVLAANTAFSDFPRLSYFMARDKFMPSQFMLRGDKLAYSIGTLTLGVLSAVLVFIFQASTHALMPLYAVGVFISFTMSQSGMVKRWTKVRGKGWQRNMIINAIGASVTASVAIILAVSNFQRGAWIVLALLPVNVMLLLSINRHYTKVSKEVALKSRPGEVVQTHKQRVIVPLGDLDEASRRALSFAASISDDITAVHVTDDPDEASALRRQWAKYDIRVPLVILESPYRSIVPPLLRYIDAVHEQEQTLPITIVLSQLIPKHLWEYPLHYRTGLRLRAAVYTRLNTIVIELPYRLES
jgi:amino acid transporter